MRFGFMFSEVSQGLRRNIAMVISIILVTFISLTFVGTASLLQLQIGQMKNYWYDKAQVAIYLCTDVSPEATCPRGEASDDVKKEVFPPGTPEQRTQLGPKLLQPPISFLSVLRQRPRE